MKKMKLKISSTLERKLSIISIIKEREPCVSVTHSCGLMKEKDVSEEFCTQVVQN